MSDDKVFEIHCCGLIIQKFDKNDQLVELFDDDFKNDCIPYYNYKIKDGTFKKLLEAFEDDNQIIKDILDFIDYIKRTRFDERSFEENLFVCIEQITSLKTKIKIFSEDKKHCCIITPTCFPGITDIEINGFKAMIYTTDYKVRMLTLFTLLMNKHLFKN